MRKLLPAFALALVPGCIAARPDAPAYPVNARFDCEGAIVSVVFLRDRAVLALPERDLALEQAVSASGARYAGDGAVFWNKGDEATLELDGTTRSCRELPNPWQQARERGIDFRAVGQEPGWLLEIDRDGAMRLLYDYAEREATVPTPAPVASGGRATYTADTGEHALTVVVEERRCQDVMSGEPFPRSVTVTIDGRELRGCGRALER